MRVLVVGRDPLARAGLVALMSEQTTLDVCGQAGDDDKVATALEATRPDAIIWDRGQDADAEPDGLADGTAGPAVLALVASPERAAAALGAGARGVLLRGAVNASHLEAAIHALVEGLFVFDPLLVSTLRVAADRHTESPIEPLTPREEEVLQRLAEGLSNKMIAQRLEISEHTVKFHINAILGKLGAESRTEAVARAARLGLITF